MTALALALVACCAMVCGTVAWAHWLSERTQADRSSTLAQKALARSDGVMEALGSHRLEHDTLDNKLSSLRAEVDSLRAQMALRGM